MSLFNLFKEEVMKKITPIDNSAFVVAEELLKHNPKTFIALWLDEDGELVFSSNGVRLSDQLGLLEIAKVNLILRNTRNND